MASSIVSGLLITALCAATATAAQAADATPTATPAPAPSTPAQSLTAVAAPTVTLPASAAITGKSVVLTGEVRVRAAADGLRSASVWFVYSGDSQATKVGATSSRRTSRLQLTVRLDAARVRLGANQLQIVDQSNGVAREVSVDLRRQSKVAITHAEFRPHSTMAIAVRVMHYDPTLDRYVASRLSPVRLEEYTGGSWHRLITLTSDSLGLAGTVLPAGPGPHYYRAIRPEGATVRSATSYTVRAGIGLTATTLSPAAPLLP